MKNFKSFKKNKKEKLKFIGSLTSATIIITLSSCSVLNNSSNSSESKSTEKSSISIEQSPLSSQETMSTSKKTIITTTYSTNSTNKTPANTETAIVQNTTFITKNSTTSTKSIETPNIQTAVPKPIETPNIQTTAPKPIETPYDSSEKTSTEIYTSEQSITKNTTSIAPAPKNRIDEIITYYEQYIIVGKKVDYITKDNINNINDFFAFFEKFFTSTTPLSFYNLYYDIESNTYESCNRTGYFEKILFLTYLNIDYINDDTLNKLAGIYTKDEVEGLSSCISSILYEDINQGLYYDYSKFVIDKNLQNLLVNVHNAYINDDFDKLEKLCNDNFDKYNSLVNMILLNYEYACNKISNFPTNNGTSYYSTLLANEFNIYNKTHQKTLVLQ